MKIGISEMRNKGEFLNLSYINGTSNVTLYIPDVVVSEVLSAMFFHQVCCRLAGTNSPGSSQPSTGTNVSQFLQRL